MDQNNQDEMTIDLVKCFENFLRAFKRMWKTVLLLVLQTVDKLNVNSLFF